MKTKVIIGILSCWKYNERRRAIGQTWAKDARRLGVDFVYLMGMDPREIKERPYPHRVGNFLMCPCPDDYPSLPQKVRWFCDWALRQKTDWDYLFKCDDDTYVMVDRLVDTVWYGNYIGTGHRTHRRRLSGGAGYLLSRTAAVVVMRELVALTGDEDVLVFDALMTEKIRPTRDDRFRRQKRIIVPHASNDLITTHYCDPEEMRRIYKSFHNES